jgi:hypothetical protein
MLTHHKKLLVTFWSIFGALFISSCLPIQAYRHIVPDQKDLHRFKHEEVPHAQQCYEFKKSTIDYNFSVHNWSNDKALCAAPLNTFLKEHKAIHFIVLQNDTILHEYCDPKQKEYVPSPSFSLAKNFVSACVGKALEQGYIGSVNDLVKSYIPELNYHPYFNELTINHLLNQKSGLRFEVDVISHANYGKIENIIPMLHFDARPGEHLEYININSTLLGIILERTTSKDVHTYFSENIWTKIGTCDSSVWAYDYRSKHTRAMSSFGGSARDYAKFGLLYLNKGKWANEQLLDSNWVIKSTSATNALGDEVGYNNSWFIGDEQVGDYMGLGMYRQQIYINPKNKMVIVCLLHFYEENLSIRWWQLFRQLVTQAERKTNAIEQTIKTVDNRHITHE